MGFQQFVPAPPLAAMIEKLWDWDIPQQAHRLERVLPLPGAALIINLHENETRVYADDGSGRCLRSSAAILNGARLRSQIIDTAEQVRVMGVVFRPGGASAFTGESMARMTDQDVDLHAVFGSGTERLRQRLLETSRPSHRLRLLEKWLLGELRTAGLDPAVARVARELGERPQTTRIAQLTRATNLSERRLVDLFKRQIGMTPKQYARLLRFRAVVDQTQYCTVVNWSAVAVDSGYCDQAHLSHEFRRFAGVTPAQFMASRGPYINHLPLD